MNSRSRKERRIVKSRRYFSQPAWYYTREQVGMMLNRREAAAMKRSAQFMFRWHGHPHARLYIPLRPRHYRVNSQERELLSRMGVH